MERTEGLGKALRKALGKDDEIFEKIVPREGGVSLLMNPTRRSIFEYLCRHPCAHLREISRALGVSPPTANWHLKALVGASVIEEKGILNKNVYYPSNFMKGKDAAVFVALKNERTRLVLEEILKRPGIRQSEIVREIKSYQQAVQTSCKQLEELRLIKSVSKGKYMGYEPSKKIEGIIERNMEQSRAFREWLLEMLRKDGVSPKVLGSSEKEMTIELNIGRKRPVMRINRQPLRHLFKNRTFKKLVADVKAKAR